MSQRTGFRISRDLALFISGLSGLIHETIIAPEPRAILVPAFIGMMFGPAVLRADEHRTDAKP